MTLKYNACEHHLSKYKKQLKLLANIANIDCPINFPIFAGHSIRMYSHTYLCTCFCVLCVHVGVYIVNFKIT